MTDGLNSGALQHEVRTLREQLRSLIHRNVDAVLVVDRHGLVQFVNPAAEALFGRSAVELVDSPLGLPLVIGETTEIDVVARGAESRVAEMRVVETDWDGQPARLAVLRDVTERKRAELEREQLFREKTARAEAEQALRERDEFLALASHELKTPAATLSATAQLLNRQLLRQGSLAPEQLQRGLERLHEQSQRLARLVEHLLDVSRINAGGMAVEPRDFDLAQLLAEIVRNAQLTTTQHAIRLTAPDHLNFDGDAMRIEQVVTNLLDNAIKYSPSGGDIDVSLAADAGEVCVAVRDRGVGVPADRRERLFERFYRAHTDGQVSGLGLGLFITHHLVALHGGTIDVESPPDAAGGTRMTVRFPRQRA